MKNEKTHLERLRFYHKMLEICSISSGTLYLFPFLFCIPVLKRQLTYTLKNKNKRVCMSISWTACWSCTKGVK